MTYGIPASLLVTEKMMVTKKEANNAADGIDIDHQKTKDLSCTVPKQNGLCRLVISYSTTLRVIQYQRNNNKGNHQQSDEIVITNSGLIVTN